MEIGINTNAIEGKANQRPHFFQKKKKIFFFLNFIQRFQTENNKKGPLMAEWFKLGSFGKSWNSVYAMVDDLSLRLYENESKTKTISNIQIRRCTEV